MSAGDHVGVRSTATSTSTDFFSPFKRWPRRASSWTRGLRLRIDGSIYERLAVRVTDPAIERLRRAIAVKLHMSRTAASPRRSTPGFFAWTPPGGDRAAGLIKTRRRLLLGRTVQTPSPTRSVAGMPTKRGGQEPGCRTRRRSRRSGRTPAPTPRRCRRKVRVARGQARVLVDDRGRHRQQDDLEPPSLRVLHVPQALEVLLQGA